jgi:hypothetical protein
MTQHQTSNGTHVYTVEETPEAIGAPFMGGAARKLNRQPSVCRFIRDCGN